MTVMTISDLIGLLREYGDQDEASGTELTEDVGEVPFEDLGLDSLGLFNTTSRIERDRGIRLRYDDVLATNTPNALLVLINECLAARL